MHSSGKFLQSVTHLNLCQCIQPIGGVRAKPLSSASALKSAQSATKITDNFISKCSSMYKILEFSQCNTHQLLKILQ